MAEALISVLLEQLVSLAYKHTKEAVTLVLNAEKDVKKFSSNLRAIQAVLEDAEKLQVKEASVRDWLDQLKDVSYEMDDVLDEWNTEIVKRMEDKQEKEGESALLSKKKVCLSTPSNCFCFGQVNKAVHYHNIAREIKELNEKLTLIAAERKEFGFHQSSVRSIDERLNQRQKTTSFVDRSTIFGRDEAESSLLGKLLSENCQGGQRLLIIPIVGMGGIGKTTLAQLAYNNENVKTNFEKRIWVCVSDPFDEVKIAKAIISGTGNNDTLNSSELEDILQCLSKSIEGKRTLIVLDDVWTEEGKQWENLKLPIIMQSCANGSRILVTTRKVGVAKMMGATTHMIHLENLSDQNCLTLFNSIAFSDREEDKYNGFEVIGEGIVKKCKGLPLAAKSLGSLMRYKKTRREWQAILDSRIWDLEEVEEQVFRPLLLSYYDLAPIVKRCLLYCATFPKDFQFDKHNLIKMWMSQGYLNMKEHRVQEDIGKNIFDNLVLRSFFQDVVEKVRFGEIGSTTSCKMHDIVHDFVQFLNKNECFTVEATDSNARMEAGTEKVRHLTLMFASGALSSSISFVNCKMLRTLATFDSKITTIDSNIASQLKCLRTLNLSCNDIEELPEEMDELVHLRYLDLSSSRRLWKLPDSLCSLYNLQTLLLGHCELLEELPEGIGNLINMRHLHVNHCFRLMYLPKGIGRLTNLQTLDRCPVYSYLDEALKLGDLGSLDQLQGSLRIDIVGDWKDTIDAENTCLWKKKQLLNLKLEFTDVQRRRRSNVEMVNLLRPHEDLECLCIREYSGSNYPSWMMSLHNLRSLSLEEWYGCEYLPPLGKLPFLEDLSIIGMEKVKTVGDEFLGMETQTSAKSSSSSTLFPKLKKLSFVRMDAWEQWEGVGGLKESVNDIRIMPCLSSLSFFDCEKLMNLPVFLRKTPVKKVSVIMCPLNILISALPENCDVEIYDSYIN